MEEQDIVQYKWQRMKHQIQGFLAFKSGSPSCIVMEKKLSKNIISFLALSTIDLTPDQTKVRVYPFMDTMQSNPATYMSPSCPVSGPQFYVISHPTCTEWHQFNSKPFLSRELISAIFKCRITLFIYCFFGHYQQRVTICDECRLTFVLTAFPSRSALSSNDCRHLSIFCSSFLPLNNTPRHMNSAN